jgi:hypothetical protein
MAEDEQAGLEVGRMAAIAFLYVYMAVRLLPPAPHLRAFFVVSRHGLL